ncbi:hypothetical protein [Nocardia thailandica]|uniref:DUF5709 domain-containing protein n=1 Tax=Nocardia thailandica TaxID=257275 RepID=A0ABW6PU17_9NOCA|nr:hypothetical protein [Nocardia thailandica]
MTEPRPSYDPPQDTGAPDAVETDPAALNSGEDLDEDRLRRDPLGPAMDPPEQWSGATKYGMTAWEQSHPRGLGERLAEEEPDVGAGSAPAPRDAEADEEAGGTQRDYEERLGISADGAGGALPEQTPEPPD